MRYLYCIVIAVMTWSSQALAVASELALPSECSGAGATPPPAGVGGNGIGGPGDQCTLTGGGVGACDDFGVCAPQAVPEMSDYLAAAFIAVAGGMIFYIRRKRQHAKT